MSDETREAAWEAFLKTKPSWYRYKAQREDFDSAYAAGASDALRQVREAVNDHHLKFDGVVWVPALSIIKDMESR